MLPQQAGAKSSETDCQKTTRWDRSDLLQYSEAWQNFILVYPQQVLQKAIKMERKIEKNSCVCRLSVGFAVVEIQVYSMVI